MQVINLLSKYNCNFPYKLEQEIGQGADGQCFNLIEDLSKVIKLGVFYEMYNDQFKEFYQQFTTVLQNIIDTKPCAYVRVYEYAQMGLYSRQHVERGVQNFGLYYYVMEKLEKISEDEKKVFHTILSHEDRGIKKNFSLEKIQKMLKEMSRGLDFDSEKIMFFCENMKKSPVMQCDLHPRNILKNGNGHFKIIDLEKCKLR